LTGALLRYFQSLSTLNIIHLIRGQPVSYYGSNSMPDNPRERTVTHLQSLYAVVVGLALTASMTSLIDATKSPPINFRTLPYFVVFLVTIVPIYHGALRHLDVNYIEKGKNQPKSGALMADWGLLFIESCGLLALALLIANDISFVWMFVGLLTFDALWGFAAHLAFTKESGGLTAEIKWSIINLSTVILLVIVFVYLDSLDPSAKPVDTYRWIVISVLAIARTLFDYGWCWNFYYPTGTRRSG
jgi:hypothetical protein